MSDLKDFAKSIWQPNLKAPLITIGLFVGGIVLNQIFGTKQSVQVEIKTAITALGAFITVASFLVIFAYRHWATTQPAAMVETALKQNRPVCHCTAVGEVMLFDPKFKSSVIWRYNCPKCNTIRQVFPDAEKS